VNQIGTPDTVTPPPESTQNVPTVHVTVPENAGEFLISLTGIKPLSLSPNTASIKPLAGSSKLKAMLENTDDLIVCPGVYDGLSARIAINVGFNALYMVRSASRFFECSYSLFQTGAGTTASRLGQPDLGIAQLHDMKEHAEMIANLDPYGAPLIADMDTGYGGTARCRPFLEGQKVTGDPKLKKKTTGPIMVDQSVKQYIRAGVAGFHIEDQVQNKRCGHLKGKKVVSREEYYVRVRAAKAAKDAMHSDIVLIARTDALQLHGYEECIERLKVARELGADVGLLEGFTSKSMAAQAVQDLAGWPLLLNMVENGATPIITTSEAKEMGFRIMIFSFASIAPAYMAIKATLQRLKEQGVVGTPKDLTPLRLFNMCGLSDSIIIDTDAGGASFKDGGGV
jgi:methylisocitrate lyase